VQVGAINEGPNASEAGMSTGGTAGAPPRLVRAAHEFEGQMMQELLKPMTNDDALTGEESDSDNGGGPGSGGALGDFASEALGQALSQHGGFGIANRIVTDLSHTRDHAAGRSNGGK
jgi:Rod binding domain-containing protein